jgi:hypothetical protein
MDVGRGDGAVVYTRTHWTELSVYVVGSAVVVMLNSTHSVTPLKVSPEK